MVGLHSEICARSTVRGCTELVAEGPTKLLGAAHQAANAQAVARKRTYRTKVTRMTKGASDIHQLRLTRQS